MIRISTIFIAICMVLIATSLGYVLYALAGFNLSESATIALATLTFLILYNAISMRMRDRATAATQVADLSRGTTDLARQVAEFGRRLAAVEQRAAAIDQLLAGEAGLAQEAFERLRGGRRLGALHLFGHRGGLERQVARDQRQAARGRIGDERAGGDAGLGEFCGEELGEIFTRLRLHAGGNFFGAEF